MNNTEPLDCGQLDGREDRVCHEMTQAIQGFSAHDFTELIEDQACGGKLSSSRVGLLGCNIVGWSLATILVVCGVRWNMSWCGTPASVIITGLATADAGVYFASKWAGHGRCNGEGS